MKIYNLQMGPVSKQKLMEERQLQEKYEYLAKAEEQHWFQRSKTKYIEVGDKNTSYFHIFANNRRRKNSITFLKYQVGNTITEKKNIAQVFEN